MKTFTSVALCVATFVTGIWLGLGKTTGKRLSNEASHLPSQSLSSPSTEPEAFRAIAVGDPRLSKLLTAVKERGRLKQRHEFYEALREVSAPELIELIARAEKLPPIYRRPLLAALIERWLELDSVAARAWIATRSPGYEILQAWAQADPATALKDAFSDKSPHQWDPDLIGRALEALAGPNVRDQLKHLGELPAGELRDQTLAQRLDQWADTEPDAAFQFANGLPPGKLRDRTRGDVLIKWAGQDPAQAVAHVKPIIPELTAGIVGNSMLTTIADRIAQKDPKAAVEFAGDLPPEFRTNPVIAAGRELAKTDPIAALEWAQELGVDITRGMRVGVGGWSGAVLKEAMLNHPEATVEWVEAFPPGAERDRLLERALRERVDNTPGADLFTNENEPIMRLFAQLPLESQQREAAAIGQSLATRPDFSDLKTVFGYFEDEISQLRAMSGAFNGLCRTNEKKAQEIYEAYTSNLPPGPAFDTATSAFAMARKERNPSGALEQAAAIRDPAILRTTLDSIMRDWVAANPKAAQQWLNNSEKFPVDFVGKWKTQAKVR